MRTDGIRRSSDFPNAQDTPRPSGLERCPTETATLPEERGFAKRDLLHRTVNPARLLALWLPIFLSLSPSPSPDSGSFLCRSRLQSAFPDGSLPAAHDGSYCWRAQSPEALRPPPKASVLHWRWRSLLPAREDT